MIDHGGSVAPQRSFSLRHEARLGGGVYAAYLLVRALVVHERGRRAALRNARQTVELEQRLGLHVEPVVQRYVIPHRQATAVANVAYVTLNIGLTVGWLGLLFARRDPAFHRFRRAWLLATAGAQPIYVLRPTAPPRGIEGFTDTIREAGIDLDAGVVSQLYNPIGAMPSIHMAYAVVIGRAMTETGRSRLVRHLGRAYPSAVAAIVIATANHFIVDVVAGAALGAASLRLAGRATEDAPR